MRKTTMKIPPLVAALLLAASLAACGGGSPAASPSSSGGGNSQSTSGGAGGGASSPGGGAKRMPLDGGRFIIEYIDGTFSYPKGVFYEWELPDNLEFAEADLYGYHIIDAQGTVLERLPYQHMQQLSNGYYRAIYDIARDTEPHETYLVDAAAGYTKSDVTIVTNSYLSGKVVYLDRSGKLLSDKVYDAGFDYGGPTAIAVSGNDMVLVSETGAELVRITDGNLKLTTDGRYYISTWGQLQGKTYATLVLDPGGKNLLLEEGYDPASYIGLGCFVRSVSDENYNRYYVVYDLEAGKDLTERKFYLVSTFDENGYARFAVKHDVEIDWGWGEPVRYGLMNREGQILIEADTFAYIGRFKDGRAIAMRGGYCGNEAGYGGGEEYSVLLYPGIEAPRYDPDGWADRPNSWYENWADIPGGGDWEWIDANGNKVGTPTTEEINAETSASGLYYYKQN